MNAPDENPDPLLRDLLADDALDALRQSSLAQGLGAMRRARRLRHMQRAALLALPVFLAAGLLSHRLPLAPATSPTVAHAPLSAPAPTSAPASSGVKTITDEELFALFPHRSLALIGQPGRQQLVLLSATAKR